jgi:hypothetical protein
VIAAVVTAAFFAGFGMGMIYGYLRVWRHVDRAERPRPTCVRCGRKIEGNDYRFRGVGIGDPPAEDGLAYEHFPRCP